MSSSTDIVNVALRLIGADRINNLTDDSAQATAANDIYDELVDDLLRSHFWNFATERAKLAQLSTAPTFGADHAYTLPAGWLRTVSVHPDSDGRQMTHYREEIVNDQQVLVTDADEVYLRYIKRKTDPNQWSADFRRAVSEALARDLAVSVASSNALHEKYDKSARRKLAQAKSSDAMGSSPETRPRGSWVTNRGRRLPEAGTIDGV